jgi:KDO2-lipid IV(A) lauroyltransferase
MNGKFSSTLLHPRYWLTWIGIGIFYLISLLPMRILHNVGGMLGRLLMKKNRKRYTVVKTNLGLCFPDFSDTELDTMVQQHFEFLMRGMMHYGLTWWASEKKLRRLLQLEGFERVSKLQQEGHNVIILLSHCSGLEFAVSAITQQFPSSGPYKPFKNPVVDYLIAKARQRFGCRTFTREDGFRPIISDARQGRVIIYLADEDLGPEVSVFAPFFGVQKATIPVLGRLAKSCKAKVLPAISCYDNESQQYKVSLLEDSSGFPFGDEKEDAKSMNQMIEKTVLRCPLQYLWILKFFKTRPDGEKGFYP